MSALNLRQLLEEIDVDIDDNNDNDDNNQDTQINLDKINLDEIKDEDSKRIVQAALDSRNNLLNDNAKQKIMLEAYKEAGLSLNKSTETVNNKNKQNNKSNDVVDDDNDDNDDNPLVKEINSLKAEVTSLKGNKEEDVKQNFLKGLTEYAQENPDTVRYAKEIQETVNKYPQMATKENISELITLAKALNERRSSQKKNTESNKNKFRTERSGMANVNVSQKQGGAKSIGEAFEATERSMRK